MLQRTVIGKNPFCPKTENSTITPLTNRYGAIFLRNRTTCGFSQRRSSSADPVAASDIRCPPVSNGIHG